MSLQDKIKFTLSPSAQVLCNISIDGDSSGKNTTLTIKFGVPAQVKDFQADVMLDTIYVYNDQFTPQADNNPKQINKREEDHVFGIDGKCSGVIKAKRSGDQDLKNNFVIDLSTRIDPPTQRDAVLVVFPLSLKTKTLNKNTFIGLRVVKDGKNAHLTLKNIVTPNSDQECSEFLSALKRLSKKRMNENDGNGKKKTKIDQTPLVKRVDCVYTCRPATKGKMANLIKDHTNIVNEEIADYLKLSEYLQEALKKTKGAAYDTYKDLSERMLDIIKNVGTRLIVAVFAKPGYGKSFMLNRLIGGESEYPLPSGETINGKGLTASIIDIEYATEYSLKKQMCTKEEYQCRLKCLSSTTDESVIPFHTDDNTLLDDDHQFKTDQIVQDEVEDNESDWVKLLKRAHQKITEYETCKTLQEGLNVKRLILTLPSPFLRDNMVILRDMPGYDECPDNNFYRQYIKESMLDVSLVLCGIENSRYILDDGIVRKLWEYGIYQAGQSVFPDVSIVVNNSKLTQELYEQVSSNTEATDGMKKSFSKQLCTHYNVAIEGVDLSDNEVADTTEIDFQNKLEFVQNLNDNFSVLYFPPRFVELSEFVNDIGFIIEKSRRKLIDCAVSDLRDIAVVMLTGPCSKMKDAVIQSMYANRLKIISEKIYNSIESCISDIATIYPDIEEIGMGHVADFIDGIVGFFESIAIKNCSIKVVNDLIDAEYETYMRKLKKESTKKAWEGHFEKYKQDIHDRIGGFVTRVKRFGRSLSSKIKNAFSIQFSDYWSTELAEELIGHLAESSGSIDNDQVHFMYTELIPYQTELENYLQDLKISIGDASVGTNKVIKDLITKYKNKFTKESVSITQTQLPKPSRLITQFSIPSDESSDTSDLVRKKVCGNLDSICKYDLEKINRYNIDMALVEHEQEDDVIHIELNRSSRIVEISYRKEIMDRLSEIKSLNSPSIKPVFIITRPRGAVWKPSLHKGTANCTFIIVTESKYVRRYRDWIGNDENYIFMSIDSNVPLGAGIVRSCVFRAAQHFNLECIHISNDDIKSIFEYSYSKKAYIENPDSIVRCLSFMEKVMAHELFSLDKKQEHIERLVRAVSDPISEDQCKMMESVFAQDPTFLSTLHTLKLAELIAQEVMEKITIRVDRMSFITQLTGLIDTHSGRAAISLIASNPQPLFDNLRRMDNAGIISSGMLIERIEEIFDTKSHIGKISLPCYHRISSLKNKAHSLSKPTHNISYPRSSLSTYYMPSMEGIYPITLDNFWEEPDNNERKKSLSRIAEQDRKKKKDRDGEKRSIERGWCLVDVSEKTQMTLNGVGGFQLVAFAYSLNSSEMSLMNYKSRCGSSSSFDSDSEPETIIIDDSEDEFDTLSDNGRSEQNVEVPSNSSDSDSDMKVDNGQSDSPESIEDIIDNIQVDN